MWSLFFKFPQPVFSALELRVSHTLEPFKIGLAPNLATLFICSFPRRHLPHLINSATPQTVKHKMYRAYLICWAIYRDGEQLQLLKSERCNGLII